MVIVRKTETFKKLSTSETLHSGAQLFVIANNFIFNMEILSGISDNCSEDRSGAQCFFRENCLVFPTNIFSYLTTKYLSGIGEEFSYSEGTNVARFFVRANNLIYTKKILSGISEK